MYVKETATVVETAGTVSAAAFAGVDTRLQLSAPLGLSAPLASSTRAVSKCVGGDAAVDDKGSSLVRGFNSVVDTLEASLLAKEGSVVFGRDASSANCSSISANVGQETAATSNVNSAQCRRSLASDNPIVCSLASGATAGAIAKTIIAPLDRTKINFQIQNVPFSLRMAFRFLSESYVKHGLSSWWRGNTATMARVIPYAALQYAAHEEWKRILRVSTPEERRAKPATSFIAGSLAGVTASSLTYPLDLARARMAVAHFDQYKNLGEVFIKIWKNEGPLSLYRGLTPTLLGVIPYAGASFFTYEWLKRHRLDYKARVADDKTGFVTNAPSITSITSHSTDSNNFQLHPIERLTCGAIAGLIGQSFSYPLDVVRRRMQTSVMTGKNYRTVRGTILYVWKHEGLRRGLYKSLSLNWIKGPISVGSSFMVYDIMMNFFKTRCL